MNLDPNSTKRRLLWHGILIFLFGLLAGATVPVLVNPRLGVAAHVGALLSGMFLLLIGLIWDEVKLPPAAAKAAFWLFLFASHTGWLAQFLAAMFGASRVSPIAGAGFQAAPWQENLAYYLAVTFAMAILFACTLALWGLGRRAAPAPLS